MIDPIELQILQGDLVMILIKNQVTMLSALGVSTQSEKIYELCKSSIQETTEALDRYTKNIEEMKRRPYGDGRNTQ